MNACHSVTAFALRMIVWKECAQAASCTNVHLYHLVTPGACEPPERRRRSVQVRFYRNIERATAVTGDYVSSLHVTTEWRWRTSRVDGVGYGVSQVEQVWPCC